MTENDEYKDGEKEKWCQEIPNSSRLNEHHSLYITGYTDQDHETKDNVMKHAPPKKNKL